VVRAERLQKGRPPLAPSLAPAQEPTLGLEGLGVAPTGARSEKVERCFGLAASVAEVERTPKAA